MQLGTTSRVAAAVGALVELLTEAAGEDFIVIEGDQPVDAVVDVIIVAPSDENTPGYLVELGSDPGLGRGLTEQTTIAVVCASYGGDSEISARRDACALMAGRLLDTVRANPVREGCWDRLIPAPQPQEWYPVHTDEGASCFVGTAVVAASLL